jgi:hypothetical protein
MNPGQIQLGVEVIEACMRGRFPPRYRRWLLETNGEIACDISVVMEHNPFSKDDILDAMFGIRPSDHSFDILSQAKEHLWLCRHHMVPVGTFASASLLAIKIDGSGDERLFCLDIADPGNASGLRSEIAVFASIDAITPQVD